MTLLYWGEKGKIIVIWLLIHELFCWRLRNKMGLQQGTAIWGGPDILLWPLLFKTLYYGVWKEEDKGIGGQGGRGKEGEGKKGRKREKETERSGGKEEGREGEKTGRDGSQDYCREEGEYLDEYTLDRYYHRGWNSGDLHIPCYKFLLHMHIS